jgi:hypothetical protein
MTGYTGGFAGTGDLLTVNGNVTLSAGGTFTYGGFITLGGTVDSTINTNGKTLPGGFRETKTAGSIILASSITCTTFRMVFRPLLIQGYTLTCAFCEFAAGSGSTASVSWGTTPGKIVISRSTTGDCLFINNGGNSQTVFATGGRIEILSPPAGVTATVKTQADNIDKAPDIYLLFSGTGTINLFLSAARILDVGAGSYTVLGGGAYREFTASSSFTGSGGGLFQLRILDSVGITFNPNGFTSTGYLEQDSLNYSLLSVPITINSSATFTDTTNASRFRSGAFTFNNNCTLSFRSLSLTWTSTSGNSLNFTGTSKIRILAQGGSGSVSADELYTSRGTITNNNPIELDFSSGASIGISLPRNVAGNASRSNLLGFKVVSGSDGSINFSTTGSLLEVSPFGMKDLILEDGTYTVSKSGTNTGVPCVGGHFTVGNGVTFAASVTQLVLNNNGTGTVQELNFKGNSGPNTIFLGNASSTARLLSNIGTNSTPLGILAFGAGAFGFASQGVLDLNSHTLGVTRVIDSTATNAVTIDFGATGKVLFYSLAVSSVTYDWPNEVYIASLSGSKNIEVEAFGTLAQGYNRTLSGTVGATTLAKQVNVRVKATGSTGRVVITGVGGNLVLEDGGYQVAGTTAGAGTIGVQGDLTLLGNSVSFGTATIAFSNTGKTSTIYSNGNTFNASFSLATAGKTVNLGDAQTCNAWTFTAGTFNLDSYLLTVSSSMNISSSTARTLNFGSGSIVLLNGSTWTSTTSTGLTISGSSRQLFAATNGGSINITQASTVSEATAFDVETIVLGSGGTVSFSNQVRNLTLTGGAYTWNATATFTIYGDLNVNGAITNYAGNTTALNFSKGSGTQVISTNGNVFGATAPITIVANSAKQLGSDSALAGAVTMTSGEINLNNFRLQVPSFASANSNTRLINFGSTGSIRLVGSGTVWNTSTNTNLTVIGSSRFIEPNLNSAQTLSFGAAAEGNLFSVRVPTTASNNTLTFTAGNRVESLEFAAVPHTIANIAINVFGDFLVSGAGPTFTAGTNAWTFAATSTFGTRTIIPNGVLLNFPITFNGVGGSWSLGSALNIAARALTLTNGSFSSANYSVTAGNFSSSNSNTRSLTFESSVWNLSGTATVWDATTATNFTVNRGTGQIILLAATAKTFAGGGLTWPILTQGGAGALTVTGSNTRFADLTRGAGVGANTISFTGGATFLFDEFTLIGLSAAARTTIQSTSTTNFIFSKSSGVVDVDFLNIVRNTATGGALWYAGNDSLQGTATTGWIFTAAPQASGNMLMLFI